MIKYNVYFRGGSLSDNEKHNSIHGKFIIEFDDLQRVKDFVKRMNKVLTKGEKSYYNMRYIYRKQF